MILEKVLSGLNINLDEQKMAMEIEDIYYDSRKVKSGSIFVAIKGELLDGHKYAKDAYERGCRIFVLEDDLDLGEDVIKIIVENTRVALSRMSCNFFGNPSKELKIIGVTGTKGKTTVANYLRNVLLTAGINAGIIGTIGVYYNDYSSSTLNTTPESYLLQKHMRNMINGGVTHLVMEVSSGGVKMHRIDDVDFDIGIFTNLSPDHIGPREHPDFEDYRYCKSTLFNRCKYGIFNADNEHVDYMIDRVSCEVATFSIEKESNFKGENIEIKREDMSLGVNYDYLKDGEFVERVYICLPGIFNAYNSLAVIGACEYLGIAREAIFEAISKWTVEGRAEVMSLLPHATVVLDFAHNGISLENILSTLSKYEHNRLISVFGSVGGRTFVRRKELGDAAAKYCDVTILTSDNPDWEDPMNIIDDIAKSFGEGDGEVIKIVDRVEAIYKAMEIAEEGDIIVIAGKGHEKYKIINGERLFFDERGEVIAAAKRLLENRK